ALDHLQLGAHGRLLAEVPDRAEPVLELLQALALLVDRALETTLLEAHLLDPLPRGAELALEDQHRLLDLLEARIECLDAVSGLLDPQIELLQLLERCATLLRHGFGSVWEWSVRGFRVADPQYVGSSSRSSRASAAFCRVKSSFSSSCAAASILRCSSWTRRSSASTRSRFTDRVNTSIPCEISSGSARMSSKRRAVAGSMVDVGARRSGSSRSASKIARWCGSAKSSGDTSSAARSTHSTPRTITTSSFRSAPARGSRGIVVGYPAAPPIAPIPGPAARRVAIGGPPRR